MTSIQPSPTPPAVSSREFADPFLGSVARKLESGERLNLVVPLPCARPVCVRVIAQREAGVDEELHHLVAGVSHVVPIVVALIGVRERAVVACVAHAITVCVVLGGIWHEGAVIHGVCDPVIVLVGREPLGVDLGARE